MCGGAVPWHYGSTKPASSSKVQMRPAAIAPGSRIRARSANALWSLPTTVDLSLHDADISGQYQAKNPGSSRDDQLAALASPALRSASATGSTIASETLRSGASGAAIRISWKSVRSANFGMTRSRAAWSDLTISQLSGPNSTQPSSSPLLGSSKGNSG